MDNQSINSNSHMFIEEKFTLYKIYFIHFTYVMFIVLNNYDEWDFILRKEILFYIAFPFTKKKTNIFNN